MAELRIGQSIVNLIVTKVSTPKREKGLENRRTNNCDHNASPVKTLKKE